MQDKSYPTNPRYKSLDVYTAGDQMQFYNMMSRLPIKSSSESSSETLSDNIFKDYDSVFPTINLYESLTCKSTFDTFDYIFYRFKKAIFVKIVDNKLVNFLPFSNQNYRNNWSDLLKANPSFSSFQSFLKYAVELAGYRYNENFINSLDRWIANNAMFRFEKQSKETMHNIDTLKNYFETLCSQRKILDVEFFLNRRDNPLLSRSGFEPYNHIFGSKYVPLTLGPLLPSFKSSYAPIYSMSSSQDFADVETITYEDWARATSQKLNLPDAYPRIQRDLSRWNDKLSTAVFRGSTTGAGTNETTNQRLKALAMMETDDSKRIDVGITKWNNRIRKYETDKYVSVISRASYPVAERLTLQQQTDKYKYILTLEGHVAAFRLGYELSSSSVVLLAGSRWSIWYQKFLIPYVHYVPIKESLDDLFSQIDWCRANDAKCVEIVRNANEFYDRYLTYDAMLDYGQKLLIEQNATCGSYSYFKLPSEIMFDQESLLMDEILKNEWSNVERKSYSYNVPTKESRTYGQLKGYDNVQKSSSDEPTFVGNIFSGKMSSVDLYDLHGISIAKKSYNDYEKMRENVHENYIGVTSMRTLCQLYPNFPFVYTPRAKEYVYMEYIKGVTLLEWLSSDKFSQSKFNEILIQINVVLEAAQNVNGFVHNDLSPWNVILQFLPTRIPINYAVRYDRKITLFVDVIVVFIDFGKSRTLVFESNRERIGNDTFDNDIGIYERSSTNVFALNNSLLDTLTVLVTSMQFIKTSKRIYENFISLVGLNPSKSFVEHYSKYGTLFRWENEKNLTPIDFVEYAMRNYDLDGIDKRDFYHQADELTIPENYIMMSGNPTYVESMIETGNEAESLLKSLVAIDKRTIAYSDNAILAKIIEMHFRPLSFWLEDRVNKVYAKYASDKLVNVWRRVKGYLFKRRLNYTYTKLDQSQFPSETLPALTIYRSEYGFGPTISPTDATKFYDDYYETHVSNPSYDYVSDWISSRLACSCTPESFTYATRSSGFDSLNRLSCANWLIRLSKEMRVENS